MQTRMILTGQICSDFNPDSTGAAGLTGVILQEDDGRFVCCLEGERHVVWAAYQRLRHGGAVEVVTNEAVPGRLFRRLDRFEVEGLMASADGSQPNSFFDAVGFQPDTAMRMVHEIARMQEVAAA